MIFQTDSKVTVEQEKAVKQLLPLILIIFSQPALAEDWKYIATGERGAVVYVDIDTLRVTPPIRINRPFEVREIWTKFDYANDETAKVSRVLSLMRVNCSENTGMTIQRISYSPDGRVAESRSESDYDFKYEAIAPSTLGRAILDFLCGREALPEFGGRDDRPPIESFHRQ